MLKLSQRQITAAMERSSSGIGVSTTVRKYLRKFYQSWGWEDMAHMRNKDLNEIVAQDFMQAQVVHRFKLKTGEVAEIRKSKNMYYVAAIRGSSYDILVVQPNYKQPQQKKQWKSELTS